MSVMLQNEPSCKVYKHEGFWGPVLYWRLEDIIHVGQIIDPHLMI